MIKGGQPVVLVVEDDEPIRNLITTTLEMEKYKFDTAQNGSQAIMLAAANNPDIILMDLGLPDMDGIEVIRKIRSWSVAPIIVISARSDEKDKVAALDVGADLFCTGTGGDTIMIKGGQPVVLVVEDDEPIRNLITTTLEMEKYKFDTAQNGSQAIMLAAANNPDIILMDLGLPDMDGIEVIRKIRSWSVAPIIVISARSDEKDKVAALDVGADDYLTKGAEELLAAEPDRAGGRGSLRQQAEDGARGHRLARAGLADERDDLPGLDGETDVLDGRARVGEGDGQVLHGQERRVVGGVHRGHDASRRGVGGVGTGLRHGGPPRAPAR